MKQTKKTTEFAPIGESEWGMLPEEMRQEMVDHWGETGNRERVASSWDKIRLFSHDNYYQERLHPNRRTLKALLRSGNEGLIEEAIDRMRQACRQEMDRQAAEGRSPTLKWDFGPEIVEALYLGKPGAAKALALASESIEMMGMVPREGDEKGSLSATGAAMESGEEEICRIVEQKGREAVQRAVRDAGAELSKKGSARPRKSWSALKRGWEWFEDLRPNIRETALEKSLFAESEEIRREAREVFGDGEIDAWIGGIRSDGPKESDANRKFATLLAQSFKLGDLALAKAILDRTGIVGPSLALNDWTQGLPRDGSLMMKAIHAGPEMFALALEAGKREGNLKAALETTAWIVETGSLRKKGDALAYCVANERLEAAREILAACPEASPKYAKDAVAYLKKKESSRGMGALSAWESLLMGKAEKILVPEAAAAPVRKRGL